MATGLYALQNASSRLLSEVVSCGSSFSGTSADSDAGSTTHKANTHLLQEVLSFSCLCFLLSAIVKHGLARVPYKWQVPFSVALCLAGMVTAALTELVLIPQHRNGTLKGIDIFLRGILSATGIDPHIVFYVFLPPLLYESASSLSWHVLRKLLASSVLLALPGVMINILLTGCLVKLITGSSDEEKMTWSGAFLLATILSATDPVAVVSALHHLGAPKKISTLIEGESLLNDGSAVVFFFVFLDQVTPTAPADMKRCPDPTVGCISSFFASLAIGGTLLGLFSAFLLWHWIRQVRKLHTPNLEVVLIIVTVYGTFVLAEAIGVSGVLAVVALGARFSASIKVELSRPARHLHDLWFQHHGYMCTSAIFFISGMVCFHYIFLDTCGGKMWQRPEMWIGLFLIYIIIHVSRAFTVILFSPFLRRWGYGLTFKEGCLLIFGGLRGAVGLSMGLMAEHNPYVSKQLANVILFHTSGIVILTLLINGSLIDEFYNRLQIYPINPFRKTNLRKSLKRVEEDSVRSLQKAKTHWFFTDIEPSWLSLCVPDLRKLDFDEYGTPGLTDSADASSNLDGLANRVCAMLEKMGRDKERGSSRMSRASSKVSKLISPIPNAVTPAEETDNNAPKMGATLSTDTNVFAGQANAFKLRTEFVQLLGGIDTPVLNTDDLRDHLFRVKDVGYKCLEWEGKCGNGLYCSSRPLTHFENDTFSVKVLDHEGSGQVVVGVQAYMNPVIAWENASTCLGNTPGSAGFSIQSGLIHSFSRGKSETSTPRGQDSSKWKGVNVSVKYENGSPIIEFADCANYENRGHVSFSGWLPDQFHPVIEFWAPSADGTGTGRRFSRTNSLRISGFGSAASLAASTVAAAAVSTAKRSSGKRENKTETDSDIEESRDGVSNLVKSHKSEPVHDMRRNMRCNTSPCLLAVQAFQAKPSVPRASARTQPFSSKSKIKLSFEPQISSQNENTTEMFQMIFHAVTHEYNRMHEHGNLSSASLLRLTDAVDHALDCNSGEKNAQRVNMVSPAGANTDFLAEFMATKTGETDTDADNQSFEPLLVEYLSIRDRLCDDEVHVFSSVTFFPRARFKKDKQNIEVLWAFTQGHEKIISGMPNLQTRFPLLRMKMMAVVKEAKGLLSRLETECNSIFFYVKNIIALRVFVTMKIMKIEHLVRDGWITHDDAETLLTALREHQHKIDDASPPNLRYKVKEGRVFARIRSSSSETGGSKLMNERVSTASVASDFSECSRFSRGRDSDITGMFFGSGSVASKSNGKLRVFNSVSSSAQDVSSCGVGGPETLAISSKNDKSFLPDVVDRIRPEDTEVQSLSDVREAVAIISPTSSFSPVVPS